MSFFDEVRARAEIAVHQSGRKGVRLHGGPMDGYLVLPDAPALEVDWYMTWPTSVRNEWEPGRYDLDPSGKWATWKDWEPPKERNS